ncbi:MAG: hypothetical protein U9N33_06100 [Campylobacterota bacterium]|nr:hypothetical protein [Campylobacterota bacterium]
MKKVFISGSINLTTLPKVVEKSLKTIQEKNIKILVGDAKGIDSLVQDYFSQNTYYNLNICSIYETPRNRINNNFKTILIEADMDIKSERKKQEKKDEYMSLNSDYSFVIWDGKSKGSFNNIQRALENDKLLKVYYTKDDRLLQENELNINTINKIYEKNNGLTLRELAKYTNLSLSIIKEHVKKHKELYIASTFRGKTSYKYDVRLIDILKQESLFG